ncbi:VF_A0006 family four-cysteine protein, partial [Pseudomonas aeruginosa]|uniref:VF_A0006 family four-cysteine protein n=1 Tax=Pseudomonas aeruginosa TaxID=287 RepID=UPI003CC536AA
EMDYDQCILDYQRTAKCGVAVQYLTHACLMLYNDGSVLLSRDMAYYECLLENLAGVENNLAAQMIRSAWESKSQN